VRIRRDSEYRTINRHLRNTDHEDEQRVQILNTDYILRNTKREDTQGL